MSAPHTKVYMAGLYDGFRIASEPDMTPQKFNLILTQQTSICRKIFEFVPIGEAWTASQISTAISRRQTTSTRPDMKTLEGCLNGMKDAGLIKEPQRGLWQQVVPRESVKIADASVKTAALTPQAEPGPLSAPHEEAALAVPAEAIPQATPAQTFGELAVQLRLRGQALIRMADDIETAALTFEQRLDDMEAKLAKFNQLRALLTEA